jgi:effector-binding domain-containing protein
MSMEVVGEFLKSILFSVIAIFGVNISTEEPRYQVIESLDPQTEIRLYAPRLAAEVSVSQSNDKKLESIAFGKLAAYIFGDNRLKSKIDMTAPVETSASGQKNKIAMTAPVDIKKDQQSLTMRFFMPTQYQPETLPQPIDPDIKIIVIPEHILAVKKYSGSADEQAITRHQEELAAKLAATPWKIAGDFRSYFYNPPWTLPFLRRNEILVEVKKQ